MQRHARAVRRDVADLDAAAVLLDDLLHDRSPRPVPLGLVVTYGSNTRGSSSCGKAAAVVARSPGARSPVALRVARRCAGSALGERSCAFCNRLWMTCRSRAGRPDHLRQVWRELQLDSRPQRFVQRQHFAHQVVQVELLAAWAPAMRAYWLNASTMLFSAPPGSTMVLGRALQHIGVGEPPAWRQACAAGVRPKAGSA